MKRIFLTGASSGIGLATAELLTSRGNEVWGTSRDVARLPTLANFHPLALDLSSPASIAGAFAKAEQESGGFDVVINNAGSGHFGPTDNVSREMLARDFQVLVFGPIQLMQLSIAAMRARRSGLIINVSSLASRLPVPFMATYNAAKAALALFTLSTSIELHGSGVRVVDLQPADIRTGFNDAVEMLANTTDDTRVTRTWRTVDRNMRNAPGPELVARRIAALIDVDNPPPQATVGDVFQSRVAPLLIRFLPTRVQLWGIRKYYGI